MTMTATVLERGAICLYLADEALSMGVEAPPAGLAPVDWGHACSI